MHTNTSTNITIFWKKIITKQKHCLQFIKKTVWFLFYFFVCCYTMCKFHLAFTKYLHKFLSNIQRHLWLERNNFNPTSFFSTINPIWLSVCLLINSWQKNLYFFYDMCTKFLIWAKHKIFDIYNLFEDDIRYMILILTKSDFNV